MSAAILARAVLAADAGVLALVRIAGVTRVYPEGEAPQPLPLPCITFRSISKVTRYGQDGPDIVATRLEFDSWAATYAEVAALAKAIRDALHAHNSDPEGIQDFEATNERDLPEDIQEAGGTRRLQRISSDFFAYARDAAA